MLCVTSNLCFMCLSENTNVKKVSLKLVQHELLKKAAFVLPELPLSKSNCPQYVCNICDKRIIYFYKFKKMCKRNYARWKFFIAKLGETNDSNQLSEMKIIVYKSGPPAKEDEEVESSSEDEDKIIAELRNKLKFKSTILKTNPVSIAENTTQNVQNTTENTENVQQPETEINMSEKSAPVENSAEKSNIFVTNCRICNKQFFTKMALEYHLKLIHNIQISIAQYESMDDDELKSMFNVKSKSKVTDEDLSDKTSENSNKLISLLKFSTDENTKRKPIDIARICERIKNEIMSEKTSSEFDNIHQSDLSRLYSSESENTTNLKIENVRSLKYIPQSTPKIKHKYDNSSSDEEWTPDDWVPDKMVKNKQKLRKKKSKPGKHDNNNMDTEELQNEKVKTSTKTNEKSSTEDNNKTTDVQITSTQKSIIFVNSEQHIPASFVKTNIKENLINFLPNTNKNDEKLTQTQNLYKETNKNSTTNDDIVIATHDLTDKTINKMAAEKLSDEKCFNNQKTIISTYKEKNSDYITVSEDDCYMYTENNIKIYETMSAEQIADIIGVSNIKTEPDSENEQQNNKKRPLSESENLKTVTNVQKKARPKSKQKILPKENPEIEKTFSNIQTKAKPKCKQKILTKTSSDIKENNTSNVQNLIEKVSTNIQTKARPKCKQKNIKNLSETVSDNVQTEARPKSKQKKQNKTRICEICDEKFTGKVVLENHLKSVHYLEITLSDSDDEIVLSENEEVTTIKTMSKYKPGPKSKRKHHQNIKVEDENSNSADELLNTIQDLIDETVNKTLGNKSSETTTDKNFIQCNICSKKFSNSRDLKTHMRSLHFSRRFQCNVCQLKFMTPGQLTIHLKRIHLKLKKLCPVCHKEFSLTSSVRKHMKRLHQNATGIKINDSDDEEYNLNLSHKHENMYKKYAKFEERKPALKSKLKQQKKKLIHEAKISVLDKDNIFCKICKKKCLNKPALISHIKSHKVILSSV